MQTILLNIFESIATGYIVVMLFLIVVSWILAVVVIARMFLGNDRHLYPTVEEIEKADMDCITWWMINLPSASNEKEIEAINMIARRYITHKNTKKQSELSARHRYAVAGQMKHKLNID